MHIESEERKAEIESLTIAIHPSDADSSMSDYERRFNFNQRSRFFRTGGYGEPALVEVFPDDEKSGVAATTFPGKP